MGSLAGNVTLAMNLSYSAAGKGSQTWNLNASHARTLVPGTGSGKVNQGCVKVLSIGLISSTINLKELPSGAAEADKAVQAGGGPDISRMAVLIIKNTHATATVTVSKPVSNGFIGLSAVLPPGASVGIDYNAGIDMGTAVNMVFQSDTAATTVELYEAGC